MYGSYYVQQIEETKLWAFSYGLYDWRFYRSRWMFISWYYEQIIWRKWVFHAALTFCWLTDNGSMKSKCLEKKIAVNTNYRIGKNFITTCVRNPYSDFLSWFTSIYYLIFLSHPKATSLKAKGSTVYICCHVVVWIKIFYLWRVLKIYDNLIINLWVG